MDNVRIIHTKLYSKIALEVLQSVEGNLSDGLWENSSAMDKYWRFSNVTTAPDGEVLINIDTKSSKADYRPGHWINNGFYDMSDDNVIKWFAAKVKYIMQTELKDNNHDIKFTWRRDFVDFTTQYLSYKEKITVSDVYFVYDFLMGRDVTKKYSGNMSLKIVRAPLSDEETKAEETRRENIAKLEVEHTLAHQRLNEDKKLKIKEIEDAFAKKFNELNESYRMKRSEFEKQV